MKNKKIQDQIGKFKAYLGKIPKKKLRTIGIVLAAVVLFSIVISALMNARKVQYTDLYTGLSASETGNILGALKDMGADVKLDSGGNIMVPKEEYDIWILQLASMGYPKTALTYDVFSSHAGMTATESEKAQWLLYQLQDRIQATLERMDGVADATVTITVPQTSDYVWETATSQQSASAGVLLSLDPGVVLSGKQVSAIRTLVASSVPKMEPDNVTVVDASTMVELTPEDDGSFGGSGGYNMAFEMMVQQQIEDNVVRLLSPRYGMNGIVAAARVTIDYDKMMTEKMEMTPNADNKGFVTHSEGSYSVNGSVAAGDIVGEDSNTDIPQYAYNAPTSDEGVTDYSWSSDYDYNYIKTQIESGNAILKRATISVMVDEDNLSDARVAELKGLVANCTDIPTDLISVSAFDKAALNEPEQAQPTAPAQEDQGSILGKLLVLPTWEYIAIGVGILLLLLLLFLVSAIKKHRRQANMRAKAEAEARARVAEALRKQEEIDDYKKKLGDIVKGKTDPKNEAILEEVREFTKENPQVAANLIRSWLREN